MIQKFSPCGLQLLISIVYFSFLVYRPLSVLTVLTDIDATRDSVDSIYYSCLADSKYARIPCGAPMSF